MKNFIEKNWLKIIIIEMIILVSILAYINNPNLVVCLDGGL